MASAYAQSYAPSGLCPDNGLLENPRTARFCATNTAQRQDQAAQGCQKDTLVETLGKSLARRREQRRAAVGTGATGRVARGWES